MFTTRERSTPKLGALLPYEGWDDETNLALLADGSIGAVLAVRPVAAELAGQGALGQIARALDGCIRRLDEGMLLQMILSVAPEPEETLDRWLRATRAPADSALAGAAGLYAENLVALARAPLRRGAVRFLPRSIEGYLTIRTHPIEYANLANASDAHAARRYRESRDRFVSIVKGVQTSMADMGMRPVWLGAQQLIDAVYRRLNPVRARSFMPAVWDRARVPMRAEMARSSLRANMETGTVLLDDLYHRVLAAVKVAPAGGEADEPATWAGMLTLEHVFGDVEASILDYIERGVVCVNVLVPDQESKRGQRRWGRWFSRKQAEAGTAEGEVKDDQIAELDREVFKTGKRVTETELIVVVAGDDPAALADQSREMEVALAHIGLDMVAEDWYAPSLLLRTLPLGRPAASDTETGRSRILTSTNAAHLAPLYGAFRGTQTPDLMLLNRRGEPVFFSPIDQLAMHGVVFGRTGGGKSMLMGMQVAAWRRRGYRVVILDVGNSYQRLCDRFGGRYVRLDADNPTLTMNVCAGPNDNWKKDFLTELVTQMYTQGQRAADAIEEGIILRCIGEAMARAGRRPFYLRSIVQRLLEYDEHPAGYQIGMAIERFTRRGPYGNMLDGDDSIPVGQNPFVVFDFTAVAERKQIRSVLVMAVMDLVMRWCQEDFSVPTLIVCDEAWKFFEAPETARTMVQGQRTGRKYQVGIWPITQTVEDFDTPLGQAVLGQNPTKFLLSHDPDATEKARRVLRLTPEQAAVYAGLTTVRGVFSDVLILSDEACGVARVVLDPTLYWTMTTHPPEVTLLRAAARGLADAGVADPEEQAIRRLARLHPSGLRGADTQEALAAAEKEVLA